ncbi:Gfo/Idh/MocA family oxidoreductase [Chitinophaga polysaccharea]|uniref:Gfo/Idh/MocA family protein n=1 Tax=Chitinophaga polysaccharea TaxID=1293035 RepID=UPI001455217B|nr:Gfo/Idh/MocA family oxidoreductase [Chitinophaga polysaccharea]NLR61855.1 Gfo/Idh/MocA family oxidoreductase [Chitinophaga polysaccharea]
MNILIIGLGSIARKHIQALREIGVSEMNIFALRSGKHFSEEEEVINISDIREAGVAIDFAIISNPTFTHYQTLEWLADYSFPLFIEKPLFHTLDNNEVLMRKLLASRRKTYVACNLRFHPCILFLKNLLDTATTKINEVNTYCGSYLPDWRPGKDYRKVYSANENMGGGVHLDLIHELDYITWLLGFPDQIKSVCRKVSNLEIDSVDYANYSLLYKDFTANIILNYYRRDTKRNCEILFEDTTVTVDLIKQQVLRGEDLLFSSSISPLYTYIEQMKYFMSIMRTDQQVMNNIEEAYTVLKICLQNNG